MLVGVNRESDLVTFWILLAILVVLPSVMGPAPQAETKPPAEVVERIDRERIDRRERRGGSRPGRRERRAQRAGPGVANQSGASRAMVLGLVAFALVIFLGWLSWDKNVDYFWAALLADDARDKASEGRLEDAHRLMSQAIGKAPDVPTYYHNRARMYEVYRESAIDTEGAPTCEQFFKLPPQGRALPVHPALRQMRRGVVPDQLRGIPQEHHPAPGQAFAGQLHIGARLDGARSCRNGLNLPVPDFLRPGGDCVLRRADKDDPAVLAPS